jgi:intracellular septation protein
MNGTAEKNRRMKMKAQRGKIAIILAGVLPLLAFALIEEYFGIVWGLIAGMTFGVGEVVWEFFTQRKVEALTWGSNVLVLGLGGVSLLTQEGIWFKLQPALLEAAFSVALWGSVIWKKPLLFSWMLKQSAQMHGQGGTGLGGGFGKGGGAESSFLGGESQHHWPEPFRKQMERMKHLLYGFTLRLGFFFIIHAGLAVWAAFYGSTSAWLLLKGVGLTASLVVYMVVEMLFLRYRLRLIS